MGGFRIDGCGVSDHFSKIKSLGQHICPNCQKNSEFFLEEAKQKIDVFFIPTLTLKSRYAIMCNQCKEGQFCSEQWARKLMIKSVGSQDTIFENEEKQPIPAEEIITSNTYQKETYQTTHVDTANVIDFKQTSCPHCGAKQSDTSGKFCSQCGEKLAVAQAGFCPDCGTKIVEGGLFCSQCGKKVN